MFRTFAPMVSWGLHKRLHQRLVKCSAILVWLTKKGFKTPFFWTKAIQATQRRTQVDFSSPFIVFWLQEFLNCLSTTGILFVRNQYPDCLWPINSLPVIGKSETCKSMNRWKHCRNSLLCCLLWSQKIRWSLTQISISAISNICFRICQGAAACR